MSKKPTVDDLSFLDTAFKFSIFFLLFSLGTLLLAMCNHAKTEVITHVNTTNH